MKRATALLFLSMATVSLSGCHALVEAFEDDPPRVNADWARAARAVRNPDTPNDDVYEPVAEYGPEDDRDTNELSDISHESELGRVVIDLGAGIYELEDKTVINGATEIILRGQGPHKTRLTLETEEMRSLVFDRAKKVVIRDLTVVAIYGGGIFVESCPDVLVENAHFAGVSYGVGLRKCTSVVRECVFAGCQRGVAIKGGSLKLSETAFMECWRALNGKGTVEVESCAFIDNHTALDVSLNRRSSVVSCLIVGEKQELGLKGRPRIMRSNLVQRRDLGKAFKSEDDNLLIKTPEQFPDAVSLPAGFDTPGVHIALERFVARGESDPGSQVADAAYEGAERYAVAAKKAFQDGNLPAAQAAAKLALRYWGKRPLSEAPDVLIEVGELGS